MTVVAESGSDGGKRLAIYMSDLSGGGVEAMKLRLIPVLCAAGWDVTLLLSVARGELKGALTVNVRVQELGGGRALADLIPLAQFLRQRRPHVLLSSLNHNNLVAILAKILSRTHTKAIFCQHNSLSNEVKEMENWKYRVVPMGYRLLNRFAARAVAVSRGVAEDMARIAGVRRDHIAVIYNPVIDADFDERANEPVSHPWFGAGLPPVFISAGRLTAQKDHLTLLRAFARFRQQHIGRLMILGAGPLLEPLQSEAAGLGIAEAVSFEGFKSNPLPYIREAHAFVLSSRYEGFCNAIVEALGCGTQVIATDCPYGPAEILQGGEFGTLVPVGDVEAMAAAMIESLGTQPNRADIIGRASEFTVEIAANNYLRLFQSVFERNH